ncbi:MAG TPA: C45 family peptidase [Rhabdochlamydiaceae bacterium]|nr:C45 family peptidase [Rhabdochlamydiaceae bacterium]
MFKKINFLIVVFFAFSAALFGSLQERDGQLILHLKGTPYERGFQHGQALQKLIAANLSTFIENKETSSNPRTQEFLKNLPKIMPFVPKHFMEEMQGVADGAGIEFKKILMLNLFPEMFHCSGITVKNEATKNGQLYHVRVLDYAIGKNLQDTAVLMVVEPEGKIPYLNVSYAGFIGTVTGMNKEKISIGEVGGHGYGYWEGIPMAFLLRELLENAMTLQQAKEIVSGSPRTCEYYYVISDGKINESIGIYATSSQVHFIENGSTYAQLANAEVPKNYGSNGDNDKFFLTDCSLESSPFQTIIKNEGKAIGLLQKQLPQTLLITGFPYPERYSILAERIEESYGAIDEKSLMEIIKKPASLDSNLHNAIFLPSELKVWISHAGKTQPAYDQPYHFYSLDELLR